MHENGEPYTYDQAKIIMKDVDSQLKQDYITELRESKLEVYASQAMTIVDTLNEEGESFSTLFAKR